MEKECIYCEVRAECVNITRINFSLEVRAVYLQLPVPYREAHP